jgi:hypothetical protein
MAETVCHYVSPKFASLRRRGDYTVNIEINAIQLSFLADWYLVDPVSHALKMNRIGPGTVLFTTTLIYIFGDADCFSLIRAAEAAVIIASLPRLTLLC